MIDRCNLWSLIEARAEATLDLPLALDERGERLSFGEYRRRSERVAAGLAERGVRPGDRVSWQLPTWIESMILVGALSRLGAVQNPIIPILREREVGFIIEQARSRLLIVPSVWRGFDYARMARAVTAQSECEVLISDRDLPEGDPAALAAADARVRDPDETRWILYTSGTTSAPKGALHSDASIAAGAWGVSTALEVTESDRWAMVFPFTHVGGIGMLFVLLMTGASGALVEQFDESTPRLLGEMGCTMAAGGTALVLRYLEQQRRQPGQPLFPALRAAMAGTAPKPSKLHYEVREELGGIGVVSCYGLTEVPFLSVSSIDDSDEQLARTEGRPTPGLEVRVVAEDGSLCPPGVSGEIRARGALVCKGYLDAKLNDDAFDSDGFFRTGDLGRLDADGCVEITGRIKDVIIRNGENVSAKEIEDLLYAHPAIAEAAVIGLPDERTGERCCAVAVPADPAHAPQLAEVVEFCRNAGLAAQKLPEQLEITAELPRNPSGKVLKYQLRERYASECTE